MIAFAANVPTVDALAADLEDYDVLVTPRWVEAEKAYVGGDAGTVGESRTFLVMGVKRYTTHLGRRMVRYSIETLEGQAVGIVSRDETDLVVIVGEDER